MKYHLILFCKKGEFSNQFLHLDFGAKNDEQALLFGKGAFELKTFNNKPIEFSAYKVQKWSWKHFDWITLKWYDSSIASYDKSGAEK